MKRTTRVVTAIALLGTFACGCGLLLPRREDITSDEAETRGRALVMRAVRAHGDQAAWDHLGDVTFTARYAQAPPADLAEVEPSQTKREIRFTFDFGRGRGRMDFADAHRSAWVRNGDDVFFVEDGKRSVRSPGPDSMRVPVEAQLFAAPFLMLAPGIHLAYAGIKPFAGRDLETVLAEPEGSAIGMHRRALGYFDPRSGELLHVAFDVGQGDVGLAGSATFLEWQTVGALRLPKRLHVRTSRLAQVHDYDLTFTDVNLAPEVDPAVYRAPPGGPP